MSTYETLQIILSAAILVTAIIAACIYGCQLIAMRKSTVAATKAAKAAEDSVLLAKQNAHLDQRGWVVVSNISGVPEVGKPFIVTMSISNVGKTFAKKLKGSPILDPSPAGKVPDFAAKIASTDEANRSRSDVIISTALLPSNSRTSVTLKWSDGNISQQAFDSIRSQQIRIFVYGRMTYEDIFASKHWITFCNVLAGAGC